MINNIYNHRIMPIIQCDNNFNRNYKNTYNKKNKTINKKNISFTEILENQLNKKV